MAAVVVVEKELQPVQQVLADLALVVTVEK
jgi:hypothetical protein